MTAEKAVIGCILLDPKFCLPFLRQQSIHYEHFYDERLRRVFVLLNRLFRERGDREFDTIVACSYLRDAGALDECGGSDFYGELMHYMTLVPAASAVEMYLEDLRDKWKRRMILEATLLLQRSALDLAQDSTDTLEWLNDRVQVFEKVAQGKRRLSLRSPSEVLGLPSGQQGNILGDRLLARGQSLTLMGAGGLGKSRLLLQMAAACILGRPFVGMPTHAPGLRWLIFQAENSVGRLQADLAALQRWAGPEWERVNECLLIHTLEGGNDYFLNLDDRSVRHQLSDLIRQHKADVVCFDPLNAFGFGDLNNDRDMRETCRALTQIVQSGDGLRSIVVLHHALTGKIGAARAIGFERSGFGRNSKLLHSWTRGQINLAPGKPDDNNTLVITCGKCSNGEEFAPYAITLQSQTMIYVEDPEFDLADWESHLAGRESLVEKSGHHELVREICLNRPPRKDAVEKIQARLKCGRSAAYSILTKAVQAGVAQFDGKLLMASPKPQSGTSHGGSSTL